MVSCRRKRSTWSEIKKGYEITKNDYVVIDKEDLDKIKLYVWRTIYPVEIELSLHV
ncbi:MAG: hypothetical protein M3297_00435 [Thermoproteota archaeon]|nr:hypothetical protein [Thermoproteota archaeon]